MLMILLSGIYLAFMQIFIFIVLHLSSNMTAVETLYLRSPDRNFSLPDNLVFFHQTAICSPTLRMVSYCVKKTWVH